MLTQLRAKCVLAWALIVHIITLRFLARKHSQEQWLNQLRNENLEPVLLQAWQRRAQSTRCNGCGECNRFAPSNVSLSNWLQGDFRNDADAQEVKSHALLIMKHASEIEKICPQHIQLDFLRDYDRA